jgi:hypothetical protein
MGLTSKHKRVIRAALRIRRDDLLADLGKHDEGTIVHRGILAAIEMLDDASQALDEPEIMPAMPAMAVPPHLRQVMEE